MQFNSTTLNEKRNNALRRIKRYQHEQFPVMLYRTNVFVHAQRVNYHLEEAISDIKRMHASFNVALARTLAWVHDDAEIITQDIPLYEKEMMTEEQKRALKRKEEKAIIILVKRYGAWINDFCYADLLT